MQESVKGFAFSLVLAVVVISGVVFVSGCASEAEVIRSIHQQLNAVDVVKVPGKWNTYMARTVKNEVYIAYGKAVPLGSKLEAELIPVLPGLRNGLMCFEEVRDGEGNR